MLSSRAKYAARAVLYLTMRGNAEPVLIQDIADAQEIPLKYLQQILATLKANGLLTSRKGPGGGYLLAISPAKLTLGAVVRAVDGPNAPMSTLSDSEPQSGQPIALQEALCGVATAVTAILNSSNFADLARRQQEVVDLEAGIQDYAI